MVETLPGASRRGQRRLKFHVVFVVHLGNGGDFADALPPPGSPTRVEKHRRQLVEVSLTRHSGARTRGPRAEARGYLRAIANAMSSSRKTADQYLATLRSLGLELEVCLATLTGEKPTHLTVKLALQLRA